MAQEAEDPFALPTAYVRLASPTISKSGAAPYSLSRRARVSVATSLHSRTGEHCVSTIPMNL